MTEYCSHTKEVGLLMLSQSSSLADISLSILWHFCPNHNAGASWSNVWKAMVSMSSQSIKEFMEHIVTLTQMRKKKKKHYSDILYAIKIVHQHFNKSNKYSVKEVISLCKCGDAQISK